VQRRPLDPAEAPAWAPPLQLWLWDADARPVDILVFMSLEETRRLWLDGERKCAAN